MKWAFITCIVIIAGYRYKLAAVRPLQCVKSVQKTIPKILSRSGRS